VSEHAQQLSVEAKLKDSRVVPMQLVTSIAVSGKVLGVSLP